MKTYSAQKSNLSFQALEMGANPGEDLQQLLDVLKLQVSALYDVTITVLSLYHTLAHMITIATKAI